MINPDLQFTLLCDDIRIENNGKFMLIGLFDNIGTSKLPVVHKRFVVINRWGKGEGVFKEQTRILSAQTGKVIVESRPVSFDLKSLDTLHNVVSEFKNVQFPHEGKYWVEVHLNDELVRSFNFYVRVVPARSGQPPHQI